MFMSLFEKLLISIKNIICHDCNDMVAYLNSRVAFLREEIENKNSEIKEYLSDRRKLMLEKEKLKKEIQKLKKDYRLPDQLYETDNIYRGTRVVIRNDGTKITYTLPRFQDYFMCSEELLKTQVKLARIKDTDDDYTKFVKALQYVQRHYMYAYDSSQYGIIENWEPIEHVIFSGKADCESLSMLVVMIARTAGVPPNKVFMAVGIYYDPERDRQFGHAWPVFYSGKNWYVGEATNMTPIRRWEDVKVKYHALSGLGNDVFSCKIKDNKDYPA